MFSHCFYPLISIRKLPAPRPASTECQSDSSHTLKGEQQANQMGSSTVNNEPAFFKQLKTTKSIKVSGPRKSNGRMRISSEKPSLQDLSLKNSLEGSFEKEKDKEKEALNSSQPSPSEENSSKNNSRVNLPLQQSHRRLSISNYGKPSGFKISSPSLAANIAESGQNNRDGLLWSLGPLQENGFNPTFAAVAKESMPASKGNIQDKSNENKKELSQVSVNFTSYDRIKEEDIVQQSSSKGNKFISKTQNKNQKFKEILQFDFADRNMKATAYFGQTDQKEAIQVNSAYTSDHYSESQPSPIKTLQFLDTKQPNEDSLTKKSIDLPDQTILSSSTTHGCSSGTITNLIDMCKDGKKRVGFEKNFRTNLVDLVRTQHTTDPRSSKKKNTINFIKANTDHQNIKGSSFESLMSQNLISNNLLNSKPEEVKERYIPPYPKGKITPTNSEDVFNDLIGISPQNQKEKSVLNKYFVLPLSKMANLNTSVSRYSETSMLNDKTINLDGISGRDLGQLSFFEHIQNVEIDEGSVLDQTRFDGGSLGRIDTIEQQTNINLNTSALNTEYNEISLLKSKSAPPIDKHEDTSVIELQKASSNQYNIKTNNSDSLSTLQFLSPQVNARTGGRRPRAASNYVRADSQVIETNRVDKSVDDEGQKKINQYLLIKEIGR